MNISRPIALCAALVLSTGCALNHDTRSLGVPVTMAAPLAGAVPGDTFTVTTRAVHLFWGLAAVRQPSLQHVLGNQLGPSTGVANLTIRSRKKLPDVVLTVLTLGVLSSTAVTYQGVLTR